jgi:hypothetical protein
VTAAAGLLQGQRVSRWPLGGQMVPLEVDCCQCQ